ncbi:MAG: RNA polymerase sigma-70 factor [Chloroflexi bacterium]|nr:MAG: RNA polymerase sigma-70 factor [Chloroflexota bacterium]
MSTAELAERERRHLFGVAYRLLGTVADAEDAVQEAFLRWEQADRAAIANPGGWLTTVLTRYCLDQLRSARARREAYVGTWLPEPLVEGADMTAEDPAERVALDESVSLAMLVVLETLSPAERAVFVLHDVFGMEFEDVATSVGRSPAACRQLAARARRHVQERRPRFEPDAAEQRRVVAAFLDASARGDLDRLLAVLDPTVVLRADGGGKVPAAGRPIQGAEQVARVLLAGHKWYPGLAGRAVAVNGGTGALMTLDDQLLGVVGVTVAEGRITAIDLVVNPDKLAGFRQQWEAGAYH